MPPKVDKIEAEIRKLAKLEGNKTCADCPEKVPGYVDLTHNVFVCTKCSGIHREFQFKIKGVSMAVFSAEDVTGMSSMGNDKFNGIYLARLNLRDYVLPSGNDINKLKEFIKLKYVDKRWHRDSGSTPLASPASAPAPAPAPMERRQSVATVTPTPERPSEIISSSSPMPANDSSTSKIAIKLNRPGGGMNRRASTGTVDLPLKKTQDLTSGMDLLSLSDNSSNGAFDPFAQAPALTNKPAVANNTDPFASPSKTTDAGFDAFGSDSSSSFDAFAAPSAVTNKSPSTNNHVTFDAFGSSSSFDPFNNHPAAPSGGGFDAFSTPAKPQQPPAQSAFIKLNPPAPAPAPAPATATATSAAASAAAMKDFGAFDDLVNTSRAPANANANVNTSASANPFDTLHAPAAPAAPMPGQYPSYPSYPPMAPQGYPQPVSGTAPPGYGYAYPPGPYAPHPAYNYAAPPAPAGYYGYAPAQPQAYGAPAPYNPAQPPTHPATAAAAPAATPDPFAAMSSLAWSAAGRNTPANPSATAAATNANPSYAMPASAPPAATPATANPFDLF